MDATAVAWLEEAGAQAPSAESAAIAREARRALDEWALARGVRLTAAESRPVPEVAVDMTTSDHVEELLSHARDAVTSGDQDGAERALASAEGLLRAHAELPNAAWLMAEVHRGWAARWSRLSSGDPSRAASEWRRAAALDGGRSAGVGESAAGRDPEVLASLALDGGGEAWLDGARVAAGPLRVRPGEHQLVVTTGTDEGQSRVVWSEWVAFAPGTTVHVAVPEPAACSAEDLARARLTSGIEPGVRATGVRCQAWVAATSAIASGAPLTLLVSTCERETCGPFVGWRLGVAPVAPTLRSAHHGWPVWATWTLAGLGVAAAAVGVTLGATGAFRSSPTEPQIVYGGLHVSGAGF